MPWVQPRRGVARPAVFLDRDGVLNATYVIAGTPRPPRSIEEVRIVTSAGEACRQLKAAGYALIVVTNQPNIARGTETFEGVRAINAAVAAEVPVDEFVICPHDDADGCACRKPKPGMLTDAAKRLGLDLRRSFMVGDRWRDVEAGRRAGCVTVYVDRGYAEKRPNSPDMVVRELAEAVPHIVAAANAKERERSASDA